MTIFEIYKYIAYKIAYGSPKCKKIENISVFKIKKFLNK